jgi:hypothetical protein
MDKNKVIKFVGGVVLPLVGAGVSLASGWFEDKKLDNKITEKVAEAVAKVSEKES